LSSLFYSSFPPLLIWLYVLLLFSFFSYLPTSSFSSGVGFVSLLPFMRPVLSCSSCVLFLPFFLFSRCILAFSFFVSFSLFSLLVFPPVSHSFLFSLFLRGCSHRFPRPSVARDLFFPFCCIARLSSLFLFPSSACFFLISPSLPLVCFLSFFLLAPFPRLFLYCLPAFLFAPFRLVLTSRFLSLW